MFIKNEGQGIESEPYKSVHFGSNRFVIVDAGKVSGLIQDHGE